MIGDERREARLGLTRFLHMGGLLGHSVGPYRSMFDLLEQVGLHYEPGAPRPRHVRMGKPGFCFYNAAQEVMKGRYDLDYVEGYAMSYMGVPVHHAWLSPKHLFDAIEVTWPREYPALAYCGVIVPHSVLEAHWRTCGGASILDDYYHHWPCLQVPYNEWDTTLVQNLRDLLTTHCQVEVDHGRAIRRADGSIFHREHLPQEERTS